MTDQVPIELTSELHQQLESQLRFVPCDLSEQLDGGMTRLDMYRNGLERMLKGHSEILSEHPDITSLRHVQQTLTAFAVLPVSTMDIAALLSVAIDVLARQRTETNDSAGDE